MSKKKLKTEPINGNIKELKGEVEYLDCTYQGTKNNDGKLIGLFQILRGGRVVCDRTYINGEMTGKHIEYHEDGVKYEGSRLKGERHGKFVTMDPEVGELDVEYYNMGTPVKTLEDTLVPNEKSQKELDLEGMQANKATNLSVLPNDEMKELNDEISKGPRTKEDIEKEIESIPEDEILKVAKDMEKHIENNPKKPVVPNGVTGKNDIESLKAEYLMYVRAGDMSKACGLMDYFTVFC